MPGPTVPFSSEPLRRMRAEEKARLAALKALNVLDTPPERCFDEIAFLAQVAFGVPLALVSFVDQDRQWFKAAIGTTARETSLDHAFCVHTLGVDQVLWVEDARADARFADSPIVTGEASLRFYAGAPIRLSTGEAIGTVCVAATEPRCLDLGLARQLRGLAELAADECALRHSLTQLAHARREAEAARRVKSAFLTNMNHELRTPLNGIIAATQMLGHGESDLARLELIEIIQSSANNLCGVLDDVLELSSLAAPDSRRSRGRFNAAEVAREALAFYRPVASQKNLAVHTELSGVDKTYTGDVSCVRQILRALISNAVKFTEAGEVRITAQARTGEGGELVTFHVVDTGPGFDSRTRAKLFQPFETGDATLTRRHGGVGAGLAIVQALIERLKGHIEVESAPGHGARFSVTFSLSPLRVQPAATAEIFPPRDDNAALSVLVAEDHPTNRRIVELILRAAGIEAQYVENGAQAVAAVEATRFDLILMDIQMPVMDGLTAIRHIRQMEKRDNAPHTAICTLTAHAMPEHEEGALAAGADAHLTKPITAPELLEAVAMLTKWCAEYNAARGKAQTAA